MTDLEYLCGIEINKIISNLFSIYSEHPDIELNPGKYLGLGPDSRDPRVVEFTFSGGSINLRIKLTEFDDPFLIKFYRGNCFDIFNVFPCFRDLTFFKFFRCNVNKELGEYIKWVVILRKKLYSLYSNFVSWENDGRLGSLFDGYRSCFVFDDTDISNRSLLFLNLWRMHSFFGSEFSKDPENFVKWYIGTHSIDKILNMSSTSLLWERPKRVLEGNVPVYSKPSSSYIQLFKTPLDRFKNILSIYREYYVTNDLVILNLCEKYGLSNDNNSFLDSFSSSKILFKGYSREDDHLVLSPDLLNDINNSNE